jgi:predicted Fe-Mo cluster-binding NifX family protein
MNICITSQGPDLESQVDPRFGRCAYYIIYDTQTDKFESISNPNLQGLSGVGIQNAQFMSEKGVEALLTGNLGPNATSVLQQSGIKTFTGISGTVKDAVENFKAQGEQQGQTPAQGNVPPHYGMSQGSGMGQGRGMGMGQGRGMGMGQGRGMQYAQPSSQPQMNSEQELQVLKQQMEVLKQQLDLIEKKIEEIKKK